MGCGHKDRFYPTRTSAIGYAVMNGKKKLLRIYKDPDNLKPPVVERYLPPELSTLHEAITFFEIGSKTNTKDSRVILNNILKNVVVEILGISDNDKDNYAYYNSNGVCIKLLEEYRLNTKYKRICKSGNIHHHITNNCKNFCRWYQKLIQSVVGPHIVHKFLDEEQLRPGDEVKTGSDGKVVKYFTVLYQFPPTIRVYNSHLLLKNKEKKDSVNNHSGTHAPRYKSLGKMHSDSVFGHQIGEINFWMPLTPTQMSSCLYAETEPGKGDWYPFHPLFPGQMMRFPGTTCRHKTIPNISGKTRVSIDFRCSMSTCFDKNYAGRVITSRRHKMLTCKYKSIVDNQIETSGPSEPKRRIVIVESEEPNG